MPPNKTAPRQPSPPNRDPGLALIPPRTRARYEYTTLSSEQPIRAAQLDTYGADGWRVVGVYVRFDTVHVILEREVTG